MKKKVDHQIAQRFGVEWSQYSHFYKDYEDQFLEWVKPLSQKFFKGKTVLDVGCGMGRNSFWVLKYQAKSLLAIDFDRNTLKAAQMNLKAFRNAEVAYKSIYDLQYKNKFDFVFSIGVVHHLSDPALALQKMIEACKPGGSVLIWLYGNQLHKVVLLIQFVRVLTSRMPVVWVHLVAYLFSVPLYSLLHTGLFRHPYFKRLRKFSFYHLHSIVFDQLLPKISRYYSHSDIDNLLAPFYHLVQYKVFDNSKMSWTVIIKKKHIQAN